MEKQKITVTVAGKNYTLVSGDPPEFVKRVAAFVDRKLNETTAVTNLPSGQAAVLTCFNLAEDLLKAAGKTVKDLSAVAVAEGPAIAALGVRGIVVVSTADHVLVAAKDRVQDLKRVLAEITSRK